MVKSILNVECKANLLASHYSTANKINTKIKQSTLKEKEIEIETEIWILIYFIQMYSVDCYTLNEKLDQPLQVMPSFAKKKYGDCDEVSSEIPMRDNKNRIVSSSVVINLHW